MTKPTLTATPAGTSSPAGDDLVWVAIRRRGITAHPVTSADVEQTDCNRSTRTGQILPAAEAAALDARWCDRCPSPRRTTAQSDLPPAGPDTIEDADRRAVVRAQLDRAFTRATASAGLGPVAPAGTVPVAEQEIVRVLAAAPLMTPTDVTNPRGGRTPFKTIDLNAAQRAAVAALPQPAAGPVVGVFMYGQCGVVGPFESPDAAHQWWTSTRYAGRCHFAVIAVPAPAALEDPAEPAGPLRQTWEDAGSPTVAAYHGRDIEPRRKAVMATFSHGGTRVYDAFTGEMVSHYASPVRMWLGPVPADVEQDARRAIAARASRRPAPTAGGPTVIAAAPTRATFKRHCWPTSGFYFGAARDLDGPGTLVTLHAAGTTVTVVDAATGAQLAQHTTRTPFWFAAARQATAVEVDAARADVAAAEAQLPEELRNETGGRLTEVTAGMVRLALSHRQHVAAAAGRGALARALGQRVAEVSAAADAEHAARAQAQEKKGARIIAQRAAEALPGELVIVPCGGKKLDQRAPAGQMYIGSYHQACRRAAAANGGRLLILSAKHGLLDPDTVIEPYELRMGDPGSVTPAQVAAQAWVMGLCKAPRVTVLAGRAYAQVIHRVWPDAVAPLAGAGGIGHQLAVLAGLAQRARRVQPSRRRPRTGPRPIPGQLALFPPAATAALCGPFALAA